MEKLQRPRDNLFVILEKLMRFVFLLLSSLIQKRQQKSERDEIIPLKPSQQQEEKQHIQQTDKGKGDLSITPLDITPAQKKNGGAFMLPPIEKDAYDKTLTSTTIKISAVLDHSGTAIDPGSSLRWGKHAKDKKVKAFNGEIGGGKATTAGEPYGYSKDNPAEEFFKKEEINYVGVASEGGKHYLQYDGHAGYDFPYPLMTPIVAPANGNLYKAALGKDNIYGARWGEDSDNSFYIEHEGGFVTWFRHCVRLHDDIENRIGNDLSKSCFVKQGQLIAYIGKVGTWAIHLHFEVRDRNGNIIDPYFDKLWL